MYTFQKMVIMEPSNVSPEMMEELNKMARDIKAYDDIPQNEAEIIRRIKDAEAVLMSYTSVLSKNILEKCDNLKYIGLCCSLYAPESANVDIQTATERGITVTGVREYGDNGVVEFVLYEIIKLFHGYGTHMFEDYAKEISETKMGIIGLGDTGRKIAGALQNLGAEVYYYSRTRKPEQENNGIHYLPLGELLQSCCVVCTCLNKNVVLLKEEEFRCLGEHSLLLNTGLSPSFEIEALQNWLQRPQTYFSCDSDLALGDPSLLSYENVSCKHKASGGTTQALRRLNQKVLENLHTYLQAH